MKQHLSKPFIAVISVLCSFYAYSQPNNAKVTIANWQGNKKGALCVTFDDGCEEQFIIGKKVLDSLGINGTFNIITNLTYNCDGGINHSGIPKIYQGTGSPAYWDTLQDAINKGHEIASHTVHHPNLDTVFKYYHIDSVVNELKLSKATLEQELHEPGTNNPYNVLTFAYPYGSGQTNDSIVDSVQKYYAVARGAGTFSKKITWDTYADATNTYFHNYWCQVESYPCEDTLTIGWFNILLSNTIKNRGWMNLMYHNIGGASLDSDLYSVSASNFRAQMETVMTKQDSLWIAPFRDVVRYSKENVSATASIKSCSGSNTVISLTDTIKNSIFNVPLTLLVSNLNCVCSIDSIIQAGNKLSFTINSNKQIQFDAIPNAGDITIYTGANTVTAIVPLADDYFELYQSAPNPASGTATISYNLKQDGNIMLELFDVNGTTTKTLLNEEQPKGKHTYSLSTEPLQPGIYFYRLTTGNVFDVKKMVVIH